MPYDLSIKGWMTEHELTILENWAKSLSNNSVIVEVGSLYGRSAYCLAASAPAGSIVYCFDRWPGDLSDNSGISNFSHDIITQHGFPTPGLKNTHDYFLSNTADLLNIKSKKINNYTEINWQHGPVVDLFFIDAAHCNPSDWEYISYWLTFVKPGGYICGHDYYPLSQTFPDITDNIRKLESMFNTTVEAYNGSSLWRIKT